MKNLWIIIHAITLILILASNGKAEETSAIVAKKKLIEQCIKQMTEPDGTGRAMAFNRLQKLGPDAESAVPALSEALKHKDSIVRIQSAYTLWKIVRQASAIQILSTELNEKANKVRDRAIAAEMLGMVGADAKAALPTLTEATKDQDPELRVKAAWALWAVDKRSDLAKPVLVAGLKQPDLNLFEFAAYALGDIGFDKPTLIALNEAIRMEPKSHWRVHAAARVIPALAKALESNDADIRQEAITVMGLMSNYISSYSGKPESQAAISALTQALHDEDPKIVAKAAEVLKKIGHQAADVPGNDKVKKGPSKDISEAKIVAKAFIVAVANKNVQEAAQYIIPEDRDEVTKELGKEIPSLPKNPEVEIRIKDDGIRANVTIINDEKTKSIVLNMKLSNRKWWIVK
jgi:HEAT repeat protein